MADNRLYLCYRPTGRIVCLGKRLGDAWYGAPTKECLDQFYGDCQKDWYENAEAGWDDFCLLSEDDNWTMENKGFVKLG